MFGNYIASKMKAIEREIISAIEENHTKSKGVFNPIARYSYNPAAPYKSQIQALSQLPLYPEQLLKLIIYSWINSFLRKSNEHIKNVETTQGIFETHFF